VQRCGIVRRRRADDRDDTVPRRVRRVHARLAATTCRASTRVATFASARVS
jgi:hypothetical protein